jgi:hypothetical protein
MSTEFGCKYLSLLKDENEINVIASILSYDLIEDTRQTFNDAKNNTNEFIANISFILTNEKGRTRKERSNLKYYNDIKNNDVATFVKICDRFANINFSKIKQNRLNNIFWKLYYKINRVKLDSMLDMYKKEHAHFKKMLYNEKFKLMFDEIDELLK